MNLESKSIVLVVDDKIENIRILGEMLENIGCDVRAANSGSKALIIARSVVPDIILLDVMMPDLDGYEVCKKLKADPVTGSIPIIFLTALNDQTNEAEGLSLGVVDYITKPFKINLVKQRIVNQLAFRKAQKELAYYANHLQEEVEKQTAELRKLNHKLQLSDTTKSLYLNLIAQEIKSPTAGILGIGQLALLEIKDENKRNRLQEIFNINKQRIEDILNSSLKLIEVYANKGIRFDSPVKLIDLYSELGLKISQTHAGHSLRYDPDENTILENSDFELLVQALEPILDLAFCLSPQDREITIKKETHALEIILIIEGNCAYNYQEIFDSPSKLTLTKDNPVSIVNLGLRLSLSEAILEILKSNIQISAKFETGLAIRLSFSRDL